MKLIIASIVTIEGIVSIVIISIIDRLRGNYCCCGGASTV